MKFDGVEQLLAGLQTQLTMCAGIEDMSLLGVRGWWDLLLLSVVEWQSAKEMIESLVKNKNKVIRVKDLRRGKYNLTI